MQFKFFSTLFIVSLGFFSSLNMLGMKGKEAASQEESCPICTTTPSGESSLAKTPCCKQGICRECLGSLGKKHKKETKDKETYWRECKECPYCRKEITTFVQEQGIQPVAQPASAGPADGYDQEPIGESIQPVSIRQLIDRGEVSIDSEGKLDLGDRSINDVTGLQDIPGIRNVRSIVLTSNRITALPANIFNGLTRLKHVSLAENLLTTVPAELFRGLTAIQSINLYFNRLENLPAGMLDDLPKLQQINLSLNPDLRDHGIESKEYRERDLQALLRQLSTP